MIILLSPTSVPKRNSSIQIKKVITRYIKLSFLLRKRYPVADNLYIESATSISRCFIYDMEGCERFGHSGNISKIDVTPLPPGNYILRIVYDEKAKRRDDFFKVVVQ